GAAGGRLERRTQARRTVPRGRRIERRHAGPETPHQGAAARVGARAVQRGPERRAVQAERGVEQDDRLIAGRQRTRAGGIPQQQNQRQHRDDAQDHERHASASAIVKRPSYSARPTQTPASPAPRAARKSSSEPTPPETITSTPSAATLLAPSISGPLIM